MFDFVLANIKTFIFFHIYTLTIRIRNTRRGHKTPLISLLVNKIACLSCVNFFFLPNVVLDTLRLALKLFIVSPRMLRMISGLDLPSVRKKLFPNPKKESHRIDHLNPTKPNDHILSLTVNCTSVIKASFRKIKKLT